MAMERREPKHELLCEFLLPSPQLIGCLLWHKRCSAERASCLLMIQPLINTNCVKKMAAWQLPYGVPFLKTWQTNSTFHHMGVCGWWLIMSFRQTSPDFVSYHGQLSQPWTQHRGLFFRREPSRVSHELSIVVVVGRSSNGGEHVENMKKWMDNVLDALDREDRRDNQQKPCGYAREAWKTHQF